MTKKRITRIALLLIASALLLFLIWLESGMITFSDRAFVNRTVRQYMLSDLSPEGHGKNADYVFDAGDNVMFISTNGYSVKVREMQNGCSLQPSTSQSWRQDMDMSVPFYFTAYCEDSSAASAQLELHIRQAPDNEVAVLWERSYSSTTSVKKGLASFAVKTESDEVADDDNWHPGDGLLGFSNRESYLEYSAFAKLQTWASTGEMPGYSAVAKLRIYDSKGELITESIFKMGEKES